MGKSIRRRRWILGRGVLCFLLIFAALAVRTEVPVTPVRPPTLTAPSIAPSLRPARMHYTALVANVPAGVRHDYIVQASSMELARRAVERVGGVIAGELEIIRAVGAALDDQELESLWDEPVAGLQVYEDASVTASGATAFPETYYPMEIGASALHTGGVTGGGVTVAVLDTGLWDHKGPLQRTSDGRAPRVLAQYDVILAREHPDAYDSPSSDEYSADIDDPHGHGTHVSAIIASSALTAAGHYQGVAPGVNLVSVRVLDSQGAGRYFDVIRGIQWAVSNRAHYGIRVLNLSLSGIARSHYWEDPLNQAVMAAWSAGIVVVAAAGNRGPDPMTIGVPGNVPYVITVGAVTDHYEPFKPNEYRLATFSSAGPTHEGFVKPEVVAMGGHIRAYAPDDGTLAQRFPQWVDSRYPDLTISGTSQAAAVTSGAVALMLGVHPGLTPNDVKCRLMASARPAVKSDGFLAYSVFQQGAGLINARDALYSTASACANVGLNVALDLSGLGHFGGRANQDAAGTFYIMDVQSSLLGFATGLLGDAPLVGNLVVGLATTLDGLFWDGKPPSGTGYNWSSTYTWGGGYTWSNGYAWSNSYTWDSGYTWSNCYSCASTGAEPAPQQ